MLRPARRRNVQVHVARLQADPVHRDQVADRVALVTVLDQLGARCRAGGEIQQQRIGGLGRPVRREAGRALRQRVVAVPSGGRLAQRDARHRGIEPGEFRRVRGVGDQVADPAALEPVLQIVLCQQRRRRDHHRAELHRRQHHLPQRHDIAEHQQDALAALDAQRTQSVGDTVRTDRQLGEGCRRGAVADDLQCQAARAVALRQLGVEPVQRVVEILRLRPLEAGMRGRIVAAIVEQKVARRLERIRRHVGLLPACPDVRRPVRPAFTSPPGGRGRRAE